MRFLHHVSSTTSRALQYDEAGKATPCFTANVVLSLPSIVSIHYICLTLPVPVVLSLQVIQPSLEDIQNAVNTAVQCISDVGEHVMQWNNGCPSSHSSTPRSNESEDFISVS